MTPAEFKAIRESFGLNVSEWCLILGYMEIRPGTIRTIQRYESGEQDLPGYIETLAEMFSRFGIPDDFLEDAGIKSYDSKKKDNVKLK